MADAQTELDSRARRVEKPKDETNVAESPAPHREAGNALFKQGDLRGALQAYEKACAAKEHDWVLALSNQAICHLRLEEYLEATAAAERCLEQAGAPPKARLTLIKALVARRDWLRAFAVLRSLHIESGVGPEVLAAAEQVEQAARNQRAALCKARCDASPGVEQPVAVNAGDEKAEAQSNDAAEFASASSSLPLTVAFALPPSVRSLAKVDLVGASDEEPFSFAGHLSQLADEVLIRMIGPKVKCPHMHEESKVIDGRTIRVQYMHGWYHDAISADDSPDLAVLCSPNLSADFEGWAPTVRQLISMKALTIVTGESFDQSLVQNEDILRALGCNVVLPTARSPHGCWIFNTCRNYHVMACRGGTPRGDVLVPAMKRRLEARGFQFDVEAEAN